MKTFTTLLTLTFVSLFFSVKLAPAQAYLDPGTGSYILQMVLAGTLGGAYLLRGYANKAFGGVKSLLTKVSGKKDGKHAK